jgi:rod shape determining protein RodA
VIAKLKRFNWISFLSMLALMVLGTIAIYSAGNARSEDVFHGMWKANLGTAIFGLVVYFLFAFFDYRKYVALFSVPAYALSVVLLVAVLFVGDSTYGGRRWLWFFQPSEVSKICILAMIAWVYGTEEGLPWLRRFPGFLIAMLLIGVPSALIFLEPDLGTMLTLVPATLLMLFVARVWRRGILTSVCLIAVVAAAVLGAVYEAEKPGVPQDRRETILKCLPLRPHQVRRVKVFLFPDEDPNAAGYTLRQALISIGSGGLSGKGLRRGETNHLKYLPQSISMNDFIFCVYAEEMGFVGSVVLLALFGAILVPCAWTAYVASDGAGRLLALGISTLVFAHVFVNIAMSVGLVPITGLPLPFISAGRTFLVVVTAGLGIVQSVSIYGREKLK